jgi:hypothetical protein
LDRSAFVGNMNTPTTSILLRKQFSITIDHYEVSSMKCNARINLAASAETYCQKEYGHEGKHEVLESIVPARTYAKPKQVQDMFTVQRGMDVQTTIFGEIPRCPHGWANPGNCPQCR